MTIHVDAEDITQDVFIKLWNNKHKISQINNIEAYAMTLTKNTCLDKIKQKKLPVVPIQDFEPVTISHAPGHKTELNDLKSLIGKIIDTLPEQQQIIVHLRDIEGYEYEEIEKITGIGINTIRVNLSRARKTIKEKITKINDYGLGKD